MRKLAITGSTLLALSLMLTACSGTDSMTTDTPPAASLEPSSTESKAESTGTLSGTFSGLNGQAVMGNVEIDGDQVKLTSFSSDEGPDLHLYLTNGADEAAVASGVVIDQVAFDQATQTFTLEGVDTADFTNVVVHCDKAKAVFGAAPIS